jgi:hypothetical protein
VIHKKTAMVNNNEHKSPKKSMKREASNFAARDMSSELRFAFVRQTELTREIDVT